MLARIGFLTPLPLSLRGEGDRDMRVSAPICQSALRAIEHGNLGISFEEKSDALKASRFYPLAIERSHKEPYKDRVVTIRSRVFPNLRRIEYFIADQGIGFDWRSLPDPKEKSNLLNRNGRGIMMARYAFDEMIYNDTGNEVTLVVNLDVPYRGRRT